MADGNITSKLHLALTILLAVGVLMLYFDRTIIDSVKNEYLSSILRTNDLIEFFNASDSLSNITKNRTIDKLTDLVEDPKELEPDEVLNVTVNTTTNTTQIISTKNPSNKPSKHPSSKPSKQPTNGYLLLRDMKEILAECSIQVQMVPEGRGDLYEVSIFYHIGMINNWKDIVADQLEKLEKCGLGYLSQSMTITFQNSNVQEKESIQMLKSLLSQYDFAVKLTNRTSFLNAKDYPHEMTIMDSIVSYCKDTADGKKRIVFYFHNKGSSRFVSEEPQIRSNYYPVHYWRTYLEAFLIDRPYLCINAILNHGTETCAAELMPVPFKHYSGNFWSASCSHLAGLRTKATWPTFNDREPSWWFVKVSSEMWIGNYTEVNLTAASVDDHYKYVSLFQSNRDLYNFHFTPDKYSWMFNETGIDSNLVKQHTYANVNHTLLWSEYFNVRRQVLEKTPGLGTVSNDMKRP